MKITLKAVVALSALVIGIAGPQSMAQTPETADATEAQLDLFAVEIKVGPNWDSSKAPSEQAFFKEHSANLKRLRDEGHIIMGARYSDIGLIIFSAKSTEEVRVMMEKDPSMKAGTFVYDVYAFNVFYSGLVQSGSRH